MKKIKFISMVLFAIAMNVGFTSCSSDDDSSSIPEEKTDYYVKYEVSARNAGYAKITWDLEFSTDKGTENATLLDGGKWEATYGPFTKGTKVFLRLSGGSSSYPANARILVSKDKEPFVIKAEHIGGSHLLKYQIDF